MSRFASLTKELMAGNRPAPSHPLQRPGSLFIPGLRTMPWHDPATFSWAPALEQAAPTIRQEVLALQDASGAFVPYIEPSPPHAGTQQWGRRKLNDRGNWDVYYLQVLDRDFQQNQSRCPVTTEVLRGIPRLTTSAFFSALGPGAHIPAHTGPTNMFLRVHLGLITPDGCAMRVGAETRRWEENKVLVFDDSFDHEVWNRSTRPRVVLIFYVYHPDFTDEEVTELAQLRGQFAIDEDRAMRQLADDMIQGRYPFHPRNVL